MGVACWRVVLTSRPSSPSAPFVAVSVSSKMFTNWYTRLSHLFRDLHSRKETREKAWQLDDWAETVSKVRFSRIVQMLSR